MRAPILIPWQADFLTALADDLAQRPDLTRTLVLFPHNRPKRYIKKLLAEHPALAKPCLLPEMSSIADFVTRMRRELDPRPFKRANTLDLVELLRTVVSDLQSAGGGLLDHLPRMTRETFLPWGIKLAALLEDLLRQDMEPSNLCHMQGEVADFAAALLEQLAAIYEGYVAGVTDRGWITSGLEWQLVLAHERELNIFLADTPVLAAGFYGLSRTEDRLFRGLWEADVLEVWLHSDSALAQGGESHWTAEEHRKWLRRWQVRPAIPVGLEYDPDHKPEVRFIEGFDRHSQLEGLRNELEAWGRGSGAVVLPDESALMPVLHHLPERDVNISMGYPLARTPLAGLLECVLALQETRDSSGSYARADFIRLIRHPYLRLLGPEDRPLRQVLHLWEAALRRGDVRDPLAWDVPWSDPVLAEVDQKAARPLLEEILGNCLAGFEPVGSLDGMALALDRLCATLRTHGAELWHTYLVDAECLFRLTASVIPQLRDAEMRFEPLDRPLLFAMFRRLLRAERVSFEPEPLSGLQVMGMLETRLLRFKRLFVLDAVEDNLPGTPPFDPLLPDPLRKILELPDSRERNNVAGYNFHRLLMGADQAVIAYPAGDAPGVLDGKSVRSRYVEELLWEREQERGQIIERGDPLIEPVNFRAGTIPPMVRSVDMTPVLAAGLREKLGKKGLSPSSLDTYLACPKKFFYSYLSSLREQEQEGAIDRSPFGTVLHQVLNDFFKPHVGTTLHAGNLDPAVLVDEFRRALDLDEECRAYPYDVRLALRLGGEAKLRMFLESQEPNLLVDLERDFETTLSGGGMTVPFKGRIDRIDRTDRGYVVLDYKSGTVSKPRTDFWEHAVWARLEDFDPLNPDPDLLPDLGRAVRSVQLPAYLHLCRMGGLTPLDNAGLVALADKGAVKWLFRESETEEERREAVEIMTPRLLGFLLEHMLGASEFRANPGTQCTWCGFRSPCGR